MDKRTWTSIFAVVSVLVVADWKSASANRSTCGSTALSVAADASMKSSIKFGPNRSTSVDLAAALPIDKNKQHLELHIDPIEEIPIHRHFCVESHQGTLQ